MSMPLNCHTASLQHCCSTRPYQRSVRTSFTIKHSFCHLIILISLHRPCLTVNQNVLFTELSQFSGVLRKSLFQVCFRSIKVIEKCSPGNISLSAKCCLIIFHRRPVQAEAMGGQQLGISKFRKIYALLVTISVINMYVLPFSYCCKIGMELNQLYFKKRLLFCSLCNQTGWFAMLQRIIINMWKTLQSSWLEDVCSCRKQQKFRTSTTRRQMPDVGVQPSGEIKVTNPSQTTTREVKN